MARRKKNGKFYWTRRGKVKNPHAKVLTSKLYRAKVIPNKKKDVRPDE